MLTSKLKDSILNAVETGTFLIIWESVNVTVPMTLAIEDGELVIIRGHIIREPYNRLEVYTFMTDMVGTNSSLVMLCLEVFDDIVLLLGGRI
jgi:hypothetical protein